MLFNYFIQKDLESKGGKHILSPRVFVLTSNTTWSFDIMRWISKAFHINNQATCALLRNQVVRSK